MQSIYSVYGTRIHLMLEDEFAEAFNRAQKAFFEAQKNHKEKYGVQWNPTDRLEIDWTEKEMNAFNDFADLMNHMVKLNGGSINIGQDDMTSDYLVKL